jgi:hypothetical protein
MALHGALALACLEEDDVMPQLDQRFIQIPEPRLPPGTSRVGGALDGLKDSHDSGRRHSTLRLIKRPVCFSMWGTYACE